jgi:hypothetical protein
MWQVTALTVSVALAVIFGVLVIVLARQNAALRAEIPAPSATGVCLYASQNPDSTYWAQVCQLVKDGV